MFDVWFNLKKSQMKVLSFLFNQLRTFFPFFLSLSAYLYQHIPVMCCKKCTFYHVLPQLIVIPETLYNALWNHLPGLMLVTVHTIL